MGLFRKTPQDYLRAIMKEERKEMHSLRLLKKYMDNANIFDLSRPESMKK